MHTDIKDIMYQWADSWEKLYGHKPFLHWGKDAKLAKDLITQLGKEKVIEALERFFQDDGEYTARAKHSIGYFYSQINRYIDGDTWPSR